MQRRRIPDAWVWRTIRHPDRVQRRMAQGTVHYWKASRDWDGRYLHVVINAQRRLVVTVFFDRRLGRRQYRRR